MSLPKSIFDRIERVYDYHAATRLSDSAPVPAPDPASEPLRYRIFDEHPKVALPTNITGAPVPTLLLLSQGVESVPDSMRQASQDLHTLASWLFLADGHTVRHAGGRTGGGVWERSCFSNGFTFPYEIYVAALGLADLPAGLYHYSPREFALRKLRDGPELLLQLKRARLDIELIKSAPAAFIVSVNCWRSAWMFRKRGYRSALADAGHLVQNIVSAGAGLGIPTDVRLRVHDQLMRDLLGIAPDANFGETELAQSIIFWAERSQHRKNESGETGSFGAVSPTSTMPPIARKALSAQVVPYGSILATHTDCVAPGVPVRDIRPPLTERSPISLGNALELPDADEPLIGSTLSKVLLETRQPADLARNPISRVQIVQLSRLAFRGGSFHPIMPDGPHVGLVRPFWIVNEAAGANPGLWFYHAKEDRWTCLREDRYRMECTYLSANREAFGNAAAVCFLVAEIKTLMQNAGPDAYRLIHLEAGIIAQRLVLAAAAMGLAAIPSGSFYDTDAMRFLGLEGTAWEPVYCVAVGHAG